MKIYSCNERKVKWYKKVDWLKTILIFIILFALFFSFFHFFIGGVGMLSTAIATAFKISFFVTVGVVISYCISNRINLYVVKDDKVYVIYPHSFGVEYDDGFVSYKEFRKVVKDEENILNILENTNKHTGIDVIKINKVVKVKKTKKNFKFVAEVLANEWEGKGGFFTVEKYVLNKRNGKMKFSVPYDYTKSAELYNLISDMNK